jgi:hypothetical protein
VEQAQSVGGTVVERGKELGGNIIDAVVERLPG